MAEKKYYWLRLQRDFFKRHDIRVIESMPNGKDYILFYLKLLVESIDHEGSLRFSETIPYNEDMLSTITNTNVDVVRCAMEVFKKLEMIEILDDQTIFMAEVSKMIGSSTMDDHQRESARIRKQRQRERESLLIQQKRDCHVTCHGEIEIEKEIEKENIKESPIVDFEKIWKDTIEIYPKKSSIASAKLEWLDIVMHSIYPLDTSKLIYKAINMYKAECLKKASNEEDPFKYSPNFAKWIKEDCDYWISKVEESERKVKHEQHS